MLKVNKWCWYTTFIIGPIVTVVVYGIFIAEAFKENNILRPWSLTFPICEIFNCIVYLIIIEGVRKDIED